MVTGRFQQIFAPEARRICLAAGLPAFLAACTCLTHSGICAAAAPSHDSVPPHRQPATTRSVTPLTIPGKVAFVLPWGEKWGKLQLDTDDYQNVEGPDGMYAAEGSLYLSGGPPNKRITRWRLSDGSFEGGIGLPYSHEDVPFMAVDNGANSSSMLIADLSWYWRMIAAPTLPPTPEKVLTFVHPNYEISRIALRNRITYAETHGITESSSHIRILNPDGQTQDTFNAYDLVTYAGAAYGLSLNRTGDQIYTSADGSLEVQCIDRNNPRTVTVHMPQLVGKARQAKNGGDRWHLLGVVEVDSHAAPTLFVFEAPRGYKDSPTLYVISRDHGVVAIVHPADSPGFKPPAHNESGDRISVDGRDIYRGYCTRAGFLVQRYHIPESLH